MIYICKTNAVHTAALASFPGSPCTWTNCNQRRAGWDLRTRLPRPYRHEQKCVRIILFCMWACEKVNCVCHMHNAWDLAGLPLTLKYISKVKVCTGSKFRKLKSEWVWKSLISDECRNSNYSLASRLPCSGTRTLKLCRRGEPGIFCEAKKCKGREWVERLCAWVYVKTQNRKKSKDSCQLKHVSCHRGTCEHTKCWTHGGWTTQKMFHFCSKTLVLFWLCHGHVRKDTRLSPHTHYSLRVKILL